MKKKFICILVLFLALLSPCVYAGQKNNSTVTQDSQLYIVGGGIAGLSASKRMVKGKLSSNPGFLKVCFFGSPTFNS
jgi:hypothetical protein